MTGPGRQFMRLMLALPRMFLHLDFENDEKCTEKRETEVKLIERLVNDRILAELESVALSAVVAISNQKANVNVASIM